MPTLHLFPLKGSDWIVAGLKCNQINTEAHRIFDSISRSEQVIVEHVNCFIKKCATLSKQHKFNHGNEKLVACVFIVCGWYNRKRELGYFN